APAAAAVPPSTDAPVPAPEKPAAKEHAKEHAKEPPSPLVPESDTKAMAARKVAPDLKFVPGKGLTFATEDGDFELQMKVRGQILGTFEIDRSEGVERLGGVQIRRARVAFQGHMFGKHNKFKMELAVSPRDASMGRTGVGTAPLLDWYMTFDYLKAATVVAGQYKVPFSRQRVVSSGSLQMVDRSIVQGEFNLDRNVGFDVRSTSLLGGHLHYFAGVYGGEGRNAFELQQNNMVYLARVELLPFGNFQDYVEADFERTGPRLSIGGSYAYDHKSRRNQGPLGRAPADGGTTNFHAVEGDLLLKMYGLSLTGEVFYRKGTRKAGDVTDAAGVPVQVEKARNGLGWFAQAGYLLPRTMFEISARYGQLRGVGDTSLKERHELGGGVSYYFARHSLKLQADYFRLWGEQQSKGADQVRLQLEAGF
ncbi:MAG: hypothetical protein HYV09_33590, partial [Deltaproteobacteria bacterium]|nr:hypothetical protein [Deltaproteobacteria bacterium]